MVTVGTGRGRGHRRTARTGARWTPEEARVRTYRPWAPAHPPSRLARKKTNGGFLAKGLTLSTFLSRKVSSRTPPTEGGTCRCTTPGDRSEISPSVRTSPSADEFAAGVRTAEGRVVVDPLHHNPDPRPGWRAPGPNGEGLTSKGPLRPGTFQTVTAEGSTEGSRGTGNQKGRLFTSIIMIEEGRVLAKDLVYSVGCPVGEGSDFRI